MTRPRVVVAGLGDTGVLAAVHLARRADVVGIGTVPEWLSGQELGLRLARPERWERDYRIGFERFRGLDHVRRVHGAVTGLDPRARRVEVRLADGSSASEEYDALVIATGVSNGFWRRPEIKDAAAIDAELRAAHARLACAGRVVVVGGGAAAVSSAANIKAAWPSTTVDLFYPGERALPRHHPRVWRTLGRRLEAAGVGLHPGHRALLPEEGAVRELGPGPVHWSTGQPSIDADVVLWAIGQVRPNSAWLPAALLDEGGFVRVRPDLRSPVHPEVFAVGDIAATDPLRTSARNYGHRLVARNVDAHLRGRPLKEYRPPRGRWGSVLGAQHDGLLVFAPDGRGFRFPAWSVDTVLQRWIVQRGIYRGVRAP